MSPVVKDCYQIPVAGTGTNALLVPEGDFVVERHRQTGHYEPDTLEAWAEACENSTYVVDVGAYTGLYCIAAAWAGVGRCIAYEPHGAAVERLRVNAYLNRCLRDITLRPYAVSSRSTPLLLKVPPGGAALSATCRVVLAHERGPLEHSVSVPGVSLDDDLKPWAIHKLGALKIDVSGHEARVIYGARGVIAAHRPLVIAETLGEESEAEVVAAMADLGYRSSYMLDGRNLVFQP